MSAPPLTAESIAIVKSTAPIMQEHGYAITTCMYKDMFHKCPHIRAMFNLSHQVGEGAVFEMPSGRAEQPQSLAAAVAAYAANIDNLGALGPAVETIAQKHVSLNVMPEHYPIVGAHLIGAVATVLGDAVTPEIAAAWTEAYEFLAHVFISRENAIREDLGAREGGFVGWKPFVVAEKFKANKSGSMMSFVLKPADGSAAPAFLGGQYLSLRVDPGTGMTTRNYSLCGVPDGVALRITVKRNTAPKPSEVGSVSSYLHDSVNVGDELDVGIPSGTFTFDHELADTAPTVLVAGGVGLTALVGMLHQVKATKAPLHYVGFFANEEEAALADIVKEKCAALANAKQTQHCGARVSADLLAEAAGGAEAARAATFYFCGSPEFNNAVRRALDSLGVPKAQQRYENFGPSLFDNAADPPPLLLAAAMQDAELLPLLTDATKLGAKLPPHSLKKVDSDYYDHGLQPAK